MIRDPKSDRRISLGIFDSDLTVAGSRTGAFVTLTIVLIAFIAIPIARPFLLGTAGIGLIVGLALSKMHNRSVDRAKPLQNEMHLRD
jgi:NhaP-type Na+/H+ and K+/H+ antiporter